MRTPRRALLASLVLLATAAPPAAAGTAEAVVGLCEPRLGPCPVALRFAAAPGERNDLEISLAANDDLRFRDTGGGGDDRLQGGLRTDRLDGGRGDDRLVGTVDSGARLPRPGRGQDLLRRPSGG